jgi:hypothetical protein
VPEVVDVRALVQLARGQLKSMIEVTSLLLGGGAGDLELINDLNQFCCPHVESTAHHEAEFEPAGLHLSMSELGPRETFSFSLYPDEQVL